MESGVRLLERWTSVVFDRPRNFALRNRTPIETDPKLDTLAKFTLAVINTKGRVGDEALAEFLEAGYTQQNALDVVLGVSLASLCNYANNLANTPINPELQPYA